MAAFNVIDVLGPDLAAPLNQGHNSVLVRVAASVPRLRALLPNIGFVGLDRFPGPAQRVHLQHAHRFPQPMAHEPSRFQRDAERAMKLVAADTLLAAAQQERGLPPNMQRNVARLEHRPNAHRELLAAGVALLQADALAALLVLHPNQGTSLADDAAMRANDTIGPDGRL